MEHDMISRRNLMISGAAAVAAGSVMNKLASAQTSPSTYTPVETPNGISLPWKMIDGVKVFHLIAEPVKHTFAPGLEAECWGYNGRTPGPTIEAVEGDRVRIFVTNRLPERTTVHWHGIIVPSGMDGVSGLSQEGIAPGETFKYEFTLKQQGTFMYHSHFDEMVQIALGMTGMFIIHPKNPTAERADRDFAIMLSEWKVAAGTRRPDPLAMNDFNVLTMNSKAFPATAPLVARLGQRVRIRFGNLGPMDHHPIHLHGYDFALTDVGSGPDPDQPRVRANTVLVPVGQTKTIEFVASNPGDWAMHCHMTHHTMNQMGHDFPNMIGVAESPTAAHRMKALLPAYMTMGTEGMGEMGAMDMPVPENTIPMKGADGPHGYIDMGGMFTILKVREAIATYEDPGWYQSPPNTLASRATPAELRTNQIDVVAPATTRNAMIYTCPMHPEVKSNDPGKCPKCGMTLVKKV
jgi:FtsP/CotA-like multicopper oxidase with cupredoxin domain